MPPATHSNWFANALGQALQVQVGLELRVELLMRGVIAVQRHNLLGRQGMRKLPWAINSEAAR